MSNFSTLILRRCLLSLAERYAMLAHEIVSGWHLIQFSQIQGQEYYLPVG